MPDLRSIFPVMPSPPTLEEQREAIEAQQTGRAPQAPSLPGISMEEQRAKIEARQSDLLYKIREHAQYGLEKSLPIGLGTAGALTGAASPMPFGALIGAGLGTAGGSALAGATRPLLTPWAPTPPLAEQAQRIGEEFLWGAGGEGIAGKIGQGVSRVMQPGRWAAWVPQEARQAQDVLRRAGSTLTPGQLANKRSVDVLESIAEGSILGGGRIQMLKEGGQADALTKAVRETVETIGRTTSDTGLGHLLIDTVSGGKRVTRSIEKGLYRGVDKLASGVQVSTKEFSGLAGAGREAEQKAIKLAFSGDPALEATLLGPRSAPTHALYPPGAPKSPIYLKPPEPPSLISFQNAQAARSKLLAMSRRKFPEAESAGIPEAASRLAKSLDTAMEDAASRLSPDALEAWRAANAFTKTGHEVLSNDLIRAAVRRVEKNPEQITRILMAENNPSTIGVIRNAVGPEKWEPFKRKIADQIVTLASAGRGDGRMDFKIFRDQLAKRGEALQAAFDPETVKALQQLADAGEFATRKVSGPGKTAIMLKQFSSLAGAGSALTFVLHPTSLTALGASVTNATVILGPEVVSRIFTNPRAVDWLTRTIRAEPGSKVFLHALGQVAGQVFGETEQAVERHFKKSGPGPIPPRGKP